MFENEKVRNEDYMGIIGWSKSYNSSPKSMFGTEIKTEDIFDL